MDVSIPDKAYFRIGEVSKILGVNTYVIRYWESEFKSIKPIRSRSDQRLYRRKDVEELLLIKRLLYQEKFTISGAKKQLMKMRGEGALPQGESDGERLAKIKRGLLQIRKIIS